MSEMIDSVARVLANASGTSRWEEAHQPYWRRMARAAIEAMAAYIDAGDMRHWLGGDITDEIRAALKEDQPSGGVRYKPSDETSNGLRNRHGCRDISGE